MNELRDAVREKYTERALNIAGGGSGCWITVGGGARRRS